MLCTRQSCDNVRVQSATQSTASAQIVRSQTSSNVRVQSAAQSTASVLVLYTSPYLDTVRVQGATKNELLGCNSCMPKLVITFVFKLHTLKYKGSRMFGLTVQTQEGLNWPAKHCNPFTVVIV